MTQRTASAGTGLPIRQPRTIGSGSPLHRLTDPGWGIEIHATVNGAGFVKWGDFYYGGGPCHAFFPYKVGHLGWILSDFLRTWSLQSRYITWGTDHYAPSPGLPPPIFPHAPPIRGHLPPSSRTISIAPSYIRRVPVNWSISQVHQIVRRYLPPGIPVPPYRPKPTFLAQSSQATSKVNWSTPLAYHADLGVPGFPDIRYTCMAVAPTGQ